MEGETTVQATDSTNYYPKKHYNNNNYNNKSRGGYYNKVTYILKYRAIIKVIITRNITIKSISIHD